MIIPGRLSLVGFRNAPFVYGIAMPGLDLRGADIHAQVRLIADTPGEPLASFGITLGFTTTPDGLPYTALTLALQEATMNGMPRSGEMGSPAQFAWDLIATPVGGSTAGLKSVYLLGNFTVLPGVTYV